MATFSSGGSASVASSYVLSITLLAERRLHFQLNRNIITD
jgi:hypothetical protein